MLAQAVLSGLAIGAIYGLIALGLVLVLKAMNLFNFAQGEMVMVGAFTGYALLVPLGLPFVIAFLGALVAGGLVGLVIEVLAIRPLRNAPALNLVTLTVAVSIILKNLGLLVGGAQSLPLPSTFGEAPVVAAGVRVVPQNVAVLAIALLLVLALSLFFKLTITGVAMRAVMSDAEAARLMGISVERSVRLTFAISGALGAAAGVLVAPSIFVSFDMGVIILKAFVAAAIGGFYSIPGALVGGALVGIVETVGAAFVSSAYRDVISYGLLIVVLLLKAEGLGGRPA